MQTSTCLYIVTLMVVMMTMSRVAEAEVDGGHLFGLFGLPVV